MYGSARNKSGVPKESITQRKCISMRGRERGRVFSRAHPALLPVVKHLQASAGTGLRKSSYEMRARSSASPDKFENCDRFTALHLFLFSPGPLAFLLVPRRRREFKCFAFLLFRRAAISHVTARTLPLLLQAGIVLRFCFVIFRFAQRRRRGFFYTIFPPFSESLP